MKSVDSKYIKKVRYDDAKSLLRAINYGGELYDVLSKDFIYRGHYSEKYLLLPYALRPGVMDAFHPGMDYEDEKVFIATQLEISQVLGEYQLLQRFYNLCDKNVLKVPDCPRLRDSVIKSYDLESFFGKENWLPKDLWEIAALAQHYGIPTRLLDWTANIKTALYFAIVDYIKPKSVEERLEQTKLLFQNRGKVEEEYCEIWALDTKVVVAKEGKLPLQLIRPPYHGNPNLAAQEGVFTLWPISKPRLPMKKDEKLDTTWLNKTPLDVLLVKKLEELQTEGRPYLYRIAFPQSAAVELYNYLEREGHTAAKLFPGYGGVAKSIIEADRFRGKAMTQKKGIENADGAEA